ncbi:MAG: hypothetical protein ACYSUI_11955 [Planctomycetota bacterium]|jgi:hypothetical protein
MTNGVTEMALMKNGSWQKAFAILLCGGVLAGGPTAWVATRDRGESAELAALANQLEIVADQTDDLWQWHNVTDPSTGAKIWYVQQSLENAIISLSESIDTQTQVMRSLCDEFKDLRRDVRNEG